MSEDHDVARSVMSAPIFGAFHRRPRAEAWHDGIDLTPRRLWRDTRFALRRLVRAPVFTISAVLVLAVGISTIVTARALLTTVTGQTSAIRDPARVFAITERQNNALSPLDLDDLRARQTVFSSIEAASGFPAAVNLRDSTTLTTGEVVTGGYFEALGVLPYSGRLIVPLDDRADASPVVVLAESFWRTALHADPTVIGRPARIGGGTYTVVGIAPATFQLSKERGGVGFYVPLSLPPATDRSLTAFHESQARDAGWLRPVARLRSSITADQAERQIGDIARALDASDPQGPSASPRRWSLHPAADAGLHTDAPAAPSLLLLPVSLFLIVCMSLANLVLSRSATRQRELGVRRALGASRASLVTELVLELAAIAGLGGALAWIMARASVGAVGRYIESRFGQWPQYQIRVALGAGDVCLLLLLVLAVVVIAGLIPAIRATAGGPWVRIAPATSNASARWRGRSTVIATQVSLSLGLLLVTSLTLNAVRQSLDDLARVTGFNRIAIATVPLSLVDRDDAAVRHHVSALLEGLSSVRAAEAFAIVSSPTRLTYEAGRVYQPEEATERDSKKWHFASVRSISAAGLRTLGAPLLKGRNFEASDGAASPAVAIINEQCARTVFGSTDVLGRTLMLDTDRWPDEFHDTLTVVGVAADAAWLHATDSEEVVYRPIDQRMVPDIALVARSTPDAANRLASDLRSVVRGVDVALPIEFAGRADVLMGASALAVIGVAKVLGTIALIAIVVTMVGLYGVLSQAVAMRRTEMGVRIALGATPRDVVALVMREGLRPVSIGVSAGLVIAVIGRLAAQPLFARPVSAIDIPVAVIAAVPLVVAAAIACYVPARRASRIDPMRVLKDL